MPVIYRVQPSLLENITRKSLLSAVLTQLVARKAAVFLKVTDPRAVNEGMMGVSAGEQPRLNPEIAA